MTQNFFRSAATDFVVVAWLVSCCFSCLNSSIAAVGVVVEYFAGFEMLVKNILAMNPALQLVVGDNAAVVG